MPSLVLPPQIPPTPPPPPPPIARRPPSQPLFPIPQRKPLTACSQHLPAVGIFRRQRRQGCSCSRPPPCWCSGRQESHRQQTRDLPQRWISSQTDSIHVRLTYSMPRAATIHTLVKANNVLAPTRTPRDHPYSNETIIGCHI